MVARILLSIVFALLVFCGVQLKGHAGFALFFVGYILLWVVWVIEPLNRVLPWPKK